MVLAPPHAANALATVTPPASNDAHAGFGSHPKRGGHPSRGAGWPVDEEADGGSASQTAHRFDDLEVHLLATPDPGGQLRCRQRLGQVKTLAGVTPELTEARPR